MALDWEAIRPVLAGLLGFNASTATAPHSPSIRQIGFSQPQIGTTTPVFLHLPTGSFTDHHTFLTGMHSLPECVLYVPTSRHLQPEIFAVANARKIAIESIADRLTQAAPASTTLIVAATLAARTVGGKEGSKEPMAILAVPPGWTWGKLQIQLLIRQRDRSGPSVGKSFMGWVLSHCRINRGLRGRHRRSFGCGCWPARFGFG